MAITKTQTPYELLVRWKDGVVAGAHVKFLETVAENGVVLLQTEGSATPVSMAGGVGYPLADILNTTQMTALITAEAATAQASAEKAAHEVTKALLAAEQAAHQQTIASKDAEIAALRVPA